jgi:hypothetical protein
MAEMAAETADETSMPEEEEPKSDNRLLMLTPEVLIPVAYSFSILPPALQKPVGGTPKGPTNPLAELLEQFQH